MKTTLIVSGVLFWLCAAVVFFGIWLVGWGDRHYKTMNKKKYESLNNSTTNQKGGGV